MLFSIYTKILLSVISTEPGKFFETIYQFLIPNGSNKNNEA
jgi:hypothetical protein